MKQLSPLFILIFFIGCITTGRIDDIFKLDKNNVIEIWTFEVKNGHISEQGTLLFRNTQDRNNRLVETIKFYEDSRIQWDYYQIKTYKRNNLFEEYYFTVDSKDKKMIDGKKVNTYFSNRKIKQTFWFDSEIPKDDTTNIKWITSDMWEYKYDSNDSLIERTSYFKGDRKRWITTYQYDLLNNTVTEMFVSLDDTTLNSTDFYKYDNSKQLIYNIHIKPFSASYDSTTYKYLEKKIVEETTYFKNGKQFTKTTYKYNDNNLLNEKKYFDMQDKLERVEKFKYLKL